MPGTKIGRLLVVISIFLCSGIEAAQPDEAGQAEQCFAQGITHFGQKQFRQAVASFQCAYQAGLDTSALHYNLGVALMRVEDYEAAIASFRRVGNDPRWEGLAYYNLALANFRLQQYPEARRWVRAVLAGNAAQSVKELALKLYRKALPEERGGVWTGEALVSLGWDSNITLGTTEAVSGVSEKDDFFTDVFGLFDYEFLGGSFHGIELFASAYGLQYQTENDFDFFLGTTGVNKRISLGSWYLEPGAFWEFAQLGHKNYYYAVAAKIDAARQIPALGRLGLRAEVQDLDEADSEFDYIAGTHLKLAAGFSKPLGPGRLEPKYEFIRDDRDDFVEGGERYSYSPQTHQVSIAYPFRIAYLWDVTPFLQVADSRFLTDDLRLNGRRAQRHDQTWNIALTASQYIKRGWRIIGQINYFDNQSNFDEFDYTRTLVSASIDWKF